MDNIPVGRIAQLDKADKAMDAIREKIDIKIAARKVKRLEQDKQAFSLLYNTLLEVGDIIQRGIREGERGHKKALHDAMAVLRRVE